MVCTVFFFCNIDPSMRCNVHGNLMYACYTVRNIHWGTKFRYLSQSRRWCGMVCHRIYYYTRKAWYTRIMIPDVWSAHWFFHFWLQDIWNPDSADTLISRHIPSYTVIWRYILVYRGIWRVHIHDITIHFSYLGIIFRCLNMPAYTTHANYMLCWIQK